MTTNQSHGTVMDVCALTPTLEEFLHSPNQRFRIKQKRVVLVWSIKKSLKGIFCDNK